MLDANKNKGRPLPYLRNPNVRWFDVDTRDLKYMPFEPHEDERYALQPGDVLVCEGGEAGRAAIWDGHVPNVKFQKAIHRVRPGPRLHNRYLVHRLLADYQSGRLADYYTGTTIKHLTGQDLARYEFPLPPIAEQQRIAAILDKTNALLAQRRATIAQLEALTHAVFVDLFGDPASNPKGWPIRLIGDLLSSASYGTSAKAGNSGEFPVLRMNNITRTGQMDFTDLKYMDLTAAQHERFLLRASDVLFNRTNSADLVGKTAVYRRSEPMAYAGYLIRLRVNRDNDAEYLSAFLNTRYAKRVLRGMCKSIIGMANINATELQAIKIPQPPLSVQRAYAERVASVVELRRVQRTSLSKLDTLFASLQHRAFNGEL